MAKVTDNEASITTAQVPSTFEGFFVIKLANGYAFSHTFIALDWTELSLDEALTEYLQDGKLHTMKLNGCAFGRKWKDTNEVYMVRGIPFPVKIKIGKINMRPGV